MGPAALSRVGEQSIAVRLAVSMSVVGIDRNLSGSRNRYASAGGMQNTGSIPKGREHTR